MAGVAVALRAGGRVGAAVALRDGVRAGVVLASRLGVRVGVTAASRASVRVEVGSAPTPESTGATAPRPVQEPSISISNNRSAAARGTRSRSRVVCPPRMGASLAQTA